jgi:4-hydroxybenzoyl-CoA thioesterase
MSFTWTQKVLFKHCDPAGIVFYPRYFEMINDCVEQFFESALHWPFEELHVDGAIPTVSSEVRFRAPSRHGDMLRFALSVAKLGDTSMVLDFTVHAGDELRLEGQSVLVRVGLDGKPKPWPDRVRAAAADNAKEAT